MLNLDQETREQDARVLEEALEKLISEHQAIIRLRHQEKLTFAQIGESMNCSADDAKRLWGQAIEELSKKL